MKIYFNVKLRFKVFLLNFFTKSLYLNLYICQSQNLNIEIYRYQKISTAIAIRIEHSFSAHCCFCLLLHFFVYWLQNNSNDFVDDGFVHSNVVRVFSSIGGVHFKCIYLELFFHSTCFYLAHSQSRRHADVFDLFCSGIFKRCFDFQNSKSGEKIEGKGTKSENYSLI